MQLKTYGRDFYPHLPSRIRLLLLIQKDGRLVNDLEDIRFSPGFNWSNYVWSDAFGVPLSEVDESDASTQEQSEDDGDFSARAPQSIDFSATEEEDSEEDRSIPVGYVIEFSE